MSWKQVVKRIAKWTVPPRFQEVLLPRLRGASMFDARLRAVLASNKVFQNYHFSERCFILGTGPSINKQNLRLLRNEICICLNSFYVHKDYSLIGPQYHLISGLAIHPLISYQQGLQWYREIDENIPQSVTLFINYLDRRFVLTHNLFMDKNVFYLDFRNEWSGFPKRGVDATKSLYPAQSVSVMAIQLALYMGFKEIYLLGLDHDWILRFAERRYTHFYGPESNALEKSGSTDWDGTDWEEQFWCNWNLWRQYRKLKLFAESLGARIYNATAGGLLDVFDRVDYESLF